MEWDAVFYGRMVERLLIVLFAGLCLYFGYRLFFVATQTQGDLEAKSGDKLYLRLKNVAPGVFFALFGSAVLVVSLVFQISVPGGTMATDKPSPQIRFAQGETGVTAEDFKVQRVAALAALMGYYRAHSDVAIEGAEKVSMPRAAAIAERLLANLIDDAFGEGAYRLYNEVQLLEVQGKIDQLGTYSEKQQALYARIEQALSLSGLADGTN